MHCVLQKVQAIVPTCNPIITLEWLHMLVAGLSAHLTLVAQTLIGFGMLQAAISALQRPY